MRENVVSPTGVTTGHETQRHSLRGVTLRTADDYVRRLTETGRERERIKMYTTGSSCGA